MTRLPERPSQPLKAYPGITLRVFGNSSFVKLQQSRKADFPIVVIELGNVKDPVNPKHTLKAYCPIVSSLFDSVRVPLNPEQLEKALTPISFTPSGMTRLPESPVQSSKADGGITLRAFDNSRDVKYLHFWKAELPISVNELGNFKDPVNPVHPLKAYCPIFPSLLDSVRVPLNPVQL